jgi:hypothetical protein
MSRFFFPYNKYDEKDPETEKERIYREMEEIAAKQQKVQNETIEASEIEPVRSNSDLVENRAKLADIDPVEARLDEWASRMPVRNAYDKPSGGRKFMTFLNTLGMPADRMQETEDRMNYKEFYQDLADWEREGKALGEVADLQKYSIARDRIDATNERTRATRDIAGIRDTTANRGLDIRNKEREDRTNLALKRFDLDLARSKSLDEARIAERKYKEAMIGLGYSRLEISKLGQASAANYRDRMASVAEGKIKTGPTEASQKTGRENAFNEFADANPEWAAEFIEEGSYNFKPFEDPWFEDEDEARKRWTKAREMWYRLLRKHGINPVDTEE